MEKRRVYPHAWQLLGTTLSAAVIVSTAAYGQEEPKTKAEEEEAVTLAPIALKAAPTLGYSPVSSSVAGLVEAPLLDTPRSVNVVSDKVIRDQNARTLDEALGNISGISQTNTLGATQDAVIRRGFGGNRDGSILIDGMKTVQPRSFDITTDRVEVLKGPSSTLYGILDPGGLVNVITKKPEFTYGGTVRSSVSSFGGGSASVDVTGPIKGTNFAYRFIAEYSDVDYWRNFGTTRSFTVSPSLTWKTDTSAVTLSYMHQDYSVPFDRGTIYDLDNRRFIDIDPKTRLDEPFNISKGSTDRLALTASHDLGAGWAVKLGYTYSRNEYTDNQSRVLGYNSSTGAVRRRVDATQGSTVEGHALRLDLTGEVMQGEIRHQLLVGASYDTERTLRTDMIRCTAAWDFNIYDPVYGTVGTCTNVSAADSDQTEDLRTGSLYIQDNIHLSERWIAVAGLRYQNYDLMAGKGRPFNANTDSHGDTWLPNAGLVFKYTPEISFYANAGKTFRPQSSIATSYGNLPPEEGVSYEIGTKMELAEGILLNAALYHSEKRNVAYSELIGDDTVIKTAGQVRARGFEVDLAGALTDQLSVIASYGYTDAVVTDDPELEGKRLPNVARHTGSVFLAYDPSPDAEGWRFGGGLRAVGARPATQENDYDLPGYVTVDTFVAYTFDRPNPVTVQLNLKNMFDKVYYTSSIGGTNYANQYGEPFSAELSASLRF